MHKRKSLVQKYFSLLYQIEYLLKWYFEEVRGFKLFSLEVAGDTLQSVLKLGPELVEFLYGDVLVAKAVLLQKGGEASIRLVKL